MCRVIEERQEGQLGPECRALWAIVRTLPFPVREMETFCKVLSKAVT